MRDKRTPKDVCGEAITQRHQRFRIHQLWCLIPMLKCNDMPQTCTVCPLPQLSFVFVFPTTLSIAYAQTLFLTVIALHLFSLFIF